MLNAFSEETIQVNSCSYEDSTCTGEMLLFQGSSALPIKGPWKWNIKRTTSIKYFIILIVVNSGRFWCYTTGFNNQCGDLQRSQRYMSHKKINLENISKCHVLNYFWLSHLYNLLSLPYNFQRGLIVYSFKRRSSDWHLSSVYCYWLNENPRNSVFSFTLQQLVNPMWSLYFNFYVLRRETQNYIFVFQVPQ